MIALECACGKKLKVKEELAGKRVRCPDCSEPVRVPVAEPEEEFLDDLEDASDEEDEAPRLPPARSTKKPAKKSASKKSLDDDTYDSAEERRRSHGGMTIKKVFGGLIFTLGIVFMVGMIALLCSGQVQGKAVRAFILPLAMIGMGWAWMKGETFGG